MSDETTSWTQSEHYSIFPPLDVIDSPYVISSHALSWLRLDLFYDNVWSTEDDTMVIFPPMGARNGVTRRGFTFSPPTCTRRGDVQHYGVHTHIYLPTTTTTTTDHSIFRAPRMTLDSLGHWRSSCLDFQFLSSFFLFRHTCAS